MWGKERGASEMSCDVVVVLDTDTCVGLSKLGFKSESLDLSPAVQHHVF